MYVNPSLPVFDPGSVESTDAEHVDTEGQL